MNDYPKRKIVLLYAIIGSLVGGLLSSIPMIFTTIQLAINGEMDFFKAIPISIFLFVATCIGGMFFGFIPALLTGIIVSYCKFYKNSLVLYLKLYGIGFLITSICYIILSMIFDEYKTQHFIQAMIGVGNIGAISSVITGFIVLPKSLNLEN